MSSPSSFSAPSGRRRGYLAVAAAAAALCLVVPPPRAEAFSLGSGASAVGVPTTRATTTTTTTIPPRRPSPTIRGRRTSSVVSRATGGGGDEATATEERRSDRDSKDLEEARGASVLLRVLSDALPRFDREDDGRGDGEKNSSSSGGSAFPWSLVDPSSDAAKRQYRDLSGDGFGPLLPVAEKVDELTGGWGLSYADLRPETPSTPLGITFLATNTFYALAGIALSVRGELLLGTLTEVAGAVSFWYHFSQLEFGQDRKEVRLALLTDYMTAGSALITAGVYLVSMGAQSIPFDVIIVGGLSVACLTMSWVWEFGYSYLFWHSLWHILSAYAGYLVGQAHMSNGGAVAMAMQLGSADDVASTVQMVLSALAISLASFVPSLGVHS